MINRIRSNKYSYTLILALLGGTVLSGCAQTQENEPVVVVASEEIPMTYNMVTVRRDKVIKSKTLNAEYTQTKEQEVTFNAGGKRIEKVYVREGDNVKVGDILAEVSSGNLDDEIARLEYDIKRNELERSYLDKHEQFELTNSYYTLAYNSRGEEEDVEKFDERDEDIRESYRNQREDIDDTLEFDRAELKKLKAELASSQLKATMNGMVYKVKDKLEGSTSKKDEVIMTIIDGTDGIFAMQEPDYVYCFKEGETVDLSIIYGSAKGDYLVMPYQMSTWGDTQYFAVFDGPENEGIEVGTSASIEVILDSKDDVLCLPNECIYKADDKSYVYVLDVNDMKNVCFVEIGMVGDTMTEIVSGLSENDMVVKR